MPYMNHVDAETPAGDRVIWRYMDFPKLFALVSTAKLYLPSLETMAKTDPYEGSVDGGLREGVAGQPSSRPSAWRWRRCIPARRPTSSSS